MEKKISLLIFLLQVSQVILSLIKLIANGEKDVDNLYPYIVIVFFKDNEDRNSSCTGSALSPSWVLSAAHCLGPKPTVVCKFRNCSKYFDSTNNKIYSKVLKKIPHPEYDFDYGSNMDHDISLLLVNNLQVDRYGELSTQYPKTIIGQPVTYAGFGSILPWKSIYKYPEGIHHATELYVASGEIVKCPAHNIQEKICVSSTVPKDKNVSKAQTTGRGDSGCPCIYSQKIIGVLSGHYYGKINPISFTPVQPYIPWIKSVIEEYKKKETVETEEKGRLMLTGIMNKQLGGNNKHNYYTEKKEESSKSKEKKCILAS